ncbi:MAG TPA: hypothetical protein VHO68_11490, partial [Bacteroidales bacterium]|nr:hypothetical protein [Bacteroidales bacterium]
MKRTYAYFISILILFSSVVMNVSGQDTIEIPLKIRTGIEVSGPALYFSNKDILNVEGYVSADLNAGTSFLIGGGYLDYSYSQYNYNYSNNGFFLQDRFRFQPDETKKSP